MKLNRFSAMSVILNRQVLKRDDANTWSIRINAGHFGTISKSNGKYFAHYHTRNTALIGRTSFMGAIADMLDAFIAFVNHIHSNVYDNSEFYCRDGWSVVSCPDNKVRIKHESYPFYQVIPHHDDSAMAYEIVRMYKGINSIFSTATEIALAYRKVFCD